MAITNFADVEAEFDAFDDWDDRYRLIIALGQALPAMDPALKTDATKVRGCASQVWLETRVESGPSGPTLRLRGDSDAHIVRGLVALVLGLYSGQLADEGKKHVIFFAHKVKGRRGRWLFCKVFQKRIYLVNEAVPVDEFTLT
jgi:sulfur transfer protein SufE